MIEAERIYLEGIETIRHSGTTLPLIGLLQVRLAAIYYQWNDIDKATEYCQTGLAWGYRTGIGDIITQGLLVQVNLAILRQDKTAVSASLGQIAKPPNWTEFDIGSIIRATQALIDVRLGNLSQAVRWADASGLSLKDQPSLKSRTVYQSLVRVRYENPSVGVEKSSPSHPPPAGAFDPFGNSARDDRAGNRLLGAKSFAARFAGTGKKRHGSPG